MPTLIDRLFVKRSLLIWLLAAILRALRLASKPARIFGGLLILSSPVGLLLFGRVEAASVTGISCIGLAWLLDRILLDGRFKEAK
jgi:hypothetical protein